MKARISGDEEYGYNPRLRKLILEVVENQMRDNNPPITNITFNRLLSEGYTEQQAKEKIAVIVANHIYPELFMHIGNCICKWLCMIKQLQS